MTSRFDSHIAEVLDQVIRQLDELIEREGILAAERELTARCRQHLPLGWETTPALAAEAVAHLWLQDRYASPDATSTVPCGSEELERCRRRLAGLEFRGEVSGWDRCFEQLVQSRQAQRRCQHGVYLTPSPVVDYMVRGLDQILRAHFGFARGLGDGVRSDRLAVVDPACGTGVFLRGLLRELQQSTTRPTSEVLAGWFQRRCLSFEIDPVTALLAQRQMESELFSPVHEFHAQVAVCNPLLETGLTARLLASICAAESPVLAVIGNPPYGNFGQGNRGGWISSLLLDYKQGLAERKINLDDDYIKFLRWSQYWVEQAGRGVVAMITNHGYLSGITHRQMRNSLSSSFDHIYVLDLHGSSIKRESHEGQRDENVFAIQQGVAIAFFVKTGASRSECQVRRHDVRGTRDGKLAFLGSHHVGDTPWRDVALRGPSFFFANKSTRDFREYQSYISLADLFGEFISGVQTKNDETLVAFTPDELRQQVLSRKVDSARAGLAIDETLVRPYIVAPWDRRFVYYDRQMLGRSRYSVMRHMLRDNLGLVFVRQSTCERYSHFLVVDGLISDRMFYSAHGTPYLAPLWLHEEGGVSSNLDEDLCREMGSRWGLRYDPAGRGELGPLDIFAYVYAVVHSPSYRQRFAASLSIDFPRIPIVAAAEHYLQLRDIGTELMDAHLRPLDSSLLPAGRDSHDECRGEVKRGFPKYVASDGVEEGAIHLAADRVLARVSRACWEFEIGGYQVLKKWIRGRGRRGVGGVESEQIALMIDAIRRTRVLVGRVDDLLVGEKSAQPVAG